MLAVGLFSVGNGLYTSMRLLLESSTYKLEPSDATPPGWLRLCAVGGSGLADEIKSGCPTTTSAGTPFVVGMEFQIRTRLFASSATTSRVPSLQIPSGSCRPV